MDARCPINREACSTKGKLFKSGGSDCVTDVWIEWMNPGFVCETFACMYPIDCMQKMVILSSGLWIQETWISLVHVGVVNVILTTPMWVVNTRLKMQGVKFRNEDLHQTHYRGIFGERFISVKQVKISDVLVLCLCDCQTSLLLFQMLSHRL